MRTSTSRRTDHHQHEAVSDGDTRRGRHPDQERRLAVESLADLAQRLVGPADLGGLGFRAGHRAHSLLVVRLADQIVTVSGGIRG